MRRKIIALLCISALILGVTDTVSATSISDIQKQQQETQDQLDAINSALSELKGEKDGIQEEINVMDTQLMQLMASIELMKEDIAVKEEEIAAAEIEYEAAVQKEEEQYQAMKKRIRFMYEKGDTTYAQLFMEAKSLREMLNKADYIEKLYEYDRNMLEEFEKTKQQVADLKEQLEVEKSELEAAKYELEEESAVLEEMLEEKKAEAEDYEVQIAQVQQEAASYKALIKQQAALIKKLEAEEAARKAAEAKKNNPSNSATTSYKPTAAAASFDVSQIDRASGSSQGKEVAKFACQFIGNPYVAGGTSLTNGADCSGFTQSVYRNFGYSIPRNSTSQRAYGKEVSIAEAEPGDLVCYAGHVALYVGNGLIVHASTQRTGIKISNVHYRPILSVRRVF